MPWRERMWAVYVTGCLTVWLTSCGGAPGPGEPSPARGLQIAIAPLGLHGSEYACWDMLVSDAFGNPIWSRGVVGTPFADGDSDIRDDDRGSLCSEAQTRGAVSYLGTCDADDEDGERPASAPNSITIWFDGVYRDMDPPGPGPEDVTVNDAGDPCPGGCRADFTCIEERDARVDFDIFLLREANVGFLDVTVDFAELRCASKVDCVYTENNGSGAIQTTDIRLVRDADGERVPTLVLALACSESQKDPVDPVLDEQVTALYMNDLTLACAHDDDGDPRTPALQTVYRVDPTAGPNNVYADTSAPPDGAFDADAGGGAIPPILAQAMVFEGVDKSPDGSDQLYWNVALGFDVDAIQTLPQGTTCTLATRATVSAGLLVNGTTPSDERYPVIDFAIPMFAVADVGGAPTYQRLCANHALNAGNGVSVDYAADRGTEQFDNYAVEVPGPRACTAHVSTACP